MELEKAPRFPAAVKTQAAETRVLPRESANRAIAIGGKKNVEGKDHQEHAHSHFEHERQRARTACDEHEEEEQGFEIDQVKRTGAAVECERCRPVSGVADKKLPFSIGVIRVEQAERQRQQKNRQDQKLARLL